MSWEWNKNKQYTSYNQWDFKTPRSYKERYGIQYKYENSDEQKKFTQNAIIVLVCVFMIVCGVMKWLT